MNLTSLVRTLFALGALAGVGAIVSACAVSTDGAGESQSTASDLSVEANYADCPVSAPQSGVACHTSLQCMYGSDPRIGCRTLSTCTTGGWLTVSNSCSEPAPSCPRSAPSGVSAPCTDAQDGLTCNYGTQSFTCAPCNGDMCIIGKKQWFEHELATACPTKTPNLGAACTATQEGIDCNYGHCENDPADPSVEGMVMSCSSGHWTQNLHYYCIR